MIKNLDTIMIYSTMLSKEIIVSQFFDVIDFYSSTSFEQNFYNERSNSIKLLYFTLH